MQRIAIIGIGCRFPGGCEDAGSYWRLLTDGRCAIGEIPSDRWSLDGFHDPAFDRPDRSYARWGGFLADIRSFDAAFFGLSSREAAAMDPQQRLLLMAACEAAHDARVTLAALASTTTGVFCGVSTVDYQLLQRYRPYRGEIQAGTGTALSIVANRVSNRLDLGGPSMGIDTACSSALVAVDTACRHLTSGSCDMAFAGGVNILLDPRMFMTFSRAHILSPTGRIRAFDAMADGFVRGEGVGVVLLRRLEDALAAGNRIYAVIEATSVNQDGRTGTLTEPSLPAQIALMRETADRAGIAPEALAYAEAHGTGTPVGDPIEATAIGTVFGGSRRVSPLPMGSAKTNLGHLEPAAGIAGLIKAALVLHHRDVPASLGFDTPNPAIHLTDLRLAVPTSTIPLGNHPQGARALVNAFGFGGTNACAILAEAPAVTATRFLVRSCPPPTINLDLAPPPLPIPLSGRTPQHLRANAAQLLRALDEGLDQSPLQELAAALASSRDQESHRSAIIASTHAELKERLAALAEDREPQQADRHAPPAIVRGRTGGSSADRPRVVFTFTGQGGQWWAMGRELIERMPLFRRSIETFDGVFSRTVGWSVMDVLLADETSSTIHDAAITPAVMFAFQNALVEVWRARGITPDIVLGHSFGEVTAAYVAGGLVMEDVARLVDQRGLIRHRVDRTGSMAAVGLGADAITPFLPADGSIEIGGYNSPDMVTLSGEDTSIDALIARLAEEQPDVLARKLALDFAYHSSWFEPVEGIFKNAVGKLSTRAPRVPVVSTVTGELNEDFSAAYWWRNLRHPVRYQRAVEQALAMDGTVFVELGPHRTLSSMTAATAAAERRSITTLTSLDKRWGDLVSLAVATAQLWATGVTVDWRCVYDGADGGGIALPRPPWITQELWQEPEEAQTLMRPSRPPHPLLGRVGAGPNCEWTSEVSLATHPFLADHCLDGSVVFPAAGYIEMLYSAARDVFGRDLIELSGLSFPAALYVDTDDELVLRTDWDAERRRLSIHARTRGGDDGAWTLHAQAHALPCDAEPETRIVSSAGNATEEDCTAFYAQAAAKGYGWGRQFQALTRLVTHPDGADAGIDASALPSPISTAAAAGYMLDPRLIDSALQTMATQRAGKHGTLLVPAGIERIRISRPLLSSARVHARFTRPSAARLAADLDITDGDGNSIVEIRGLDARARPSAHARAAGSSAPLIAERFEPIELAIAPRDVERWLAVADPRDRAAMTLIDGLADNGLLFTTSGGRACIEPAGLGEALADGAAARSGLLVIMPAIDQADIASATSAVAAFAIACARGTASCSDVAYPARIVLLTRSARLARETDTLDVSGVAHASALGVMRTLALEAPHLRVRLVDADEAALRHCASLAHALASDTPHGELAVRGSGCLASRLDVVEPAAIAPKTLSLAALGTSRTFALRSDGTGIDGLHWSTVARRSPGPGEVEIDVRAAGLNFRDLMAVTGALPEDAESSPAIDALGLEFSGVVVRRGDGVMDLDIGQRVLGMARGALRGSVTIPSLAVFETPSRLTDEEAAALPSVYLTAWYALVHLARLTSSDSVLVHSATGGLGQAAIAVCRHIGARVIATAGTLEKRAYLRSTGVEHVFDSRSLDFANGVRSATGGRGVDVALNALGGAFIETTLACLAPYGRFIEAGKRDIYADAPIGLRRLARNISFHAVDLAALIEDRPQQAAAMMREMLALVASGSLPPPKTERYASTNVRDAFRDFAAASHIGKLAIALERSGLSVRPGYARATSPEGSPHTTRERSLDSEGSYLVTGGTRGFGLSIARDLVRRGAGRVIAASLSGTIAADAEDSNAIDAVSLDVTDSSSVEALISKLSSSGMPLRGIVHAAVTYADALLDDVTPQTLDAVLATKVAGAAHLTDAVVRHGIALEFFLSISSMAHVTGWPGQASYAAANAALEALSSHQRARGIPGQCINLGMLGGAGHVARDASLTSYLDSAGWVALDDRSALEAIDTVLDADVHALTAASADWPRLAASHGALARAPRLRTLVEAGGRSRGSTSDDLAGLTGDDLRCAVARIIREEAAKVLRAAPNSLADVATLQDAGIDSLSSFELHNRIEHRLRLEIPLARYTRTSRIDDLADLAARLIEGAKRHAS